MSKIIVERTGTAVPHPTEPGKFVVPGNPQYPKESWGKIVETEKFSWNEEVELSFGEERIRTYFQYGNNDRVQNFKERFAKLLNQINDIPANNPEEYRLKALALTAAEESAMWLVKLLTSPKA